MFSSTLGLACILYLVGIGTVLYIRPRSMFRPGGVWREFGLSDSEHSTLFPFWMFVLVWAVFSYALATCLVLVAGSVAAPSDDGLELFSEPLIQPVTSTNVAPAAASPTPGYYILNPNRVNATGANYVYYGPTPPPA